MSSLPPYNPGPGEDAVWLVAVDQTGSQPVALPAPPAGWSVVFIDGDARREVAVRLCPGARVEVVEELPGSPTRGTGWSAVVGSPAFVENALRRVMGMPDGSAQFVMRPGAVSVVQLLADRAVLARLNNGAALDALEE